MSLDRNRPLGRRLAYIDALRGWAILLVILDHAGQGRQAIVALGSPDLAGVNDLALPIWLSLVCIGGINGVVLFFVLSALSLTLSLGSGSRIDLRAFALRRYFRLAPMYYVGVALYFLLYGSAPRVFAVSGVTVGDIVANLTFTHGFRNNALNSVVPGGWSIAAEALFYAILPIILIVTRRKRAIIFALALLALCASTIYLTDPPTAVHITNVSKFKFINYLPAFLIGVGTAIHLNPQIRRAAARSNDETPISATLPLVLLLFLIFIVPQLTLLVAMAPIERLHIIFGILMTALMGAFICARLHGQQYPNPIVVNPVLERIGLVSFSMYIIHFALLPVVFPFVKLIVAGEGIGFLIAYYIILATVTFAIANVTYTLIERPFIRFSRRL